MISTETPRWLTVKEVADITGLAEQTLHNMRFQGTGISYSRLGAKGRAIRYLLKDVVEYAESRKIQPVNA